MRRWDRFCDGKRVESDPEIKPLAKAKILVVLMVASLLAVVVLQNTDDVETQLLFTTVTMPRAALLSLTALIGFVLGLLTALALSRSPKKPDDR